MRATLGMFLLLALCCTQGRQESMSEPHPTSGRPAQDAGAPSPAPVGRGGSSLPGPEAPPLPGAAAAAPIRAPVIEGCLALALGDENGAARYPAPPPTRSAAPDVSLKTSPGRLEVSHHLRHACCLKGAVTVNRSEAEVTVEEKISGSPCRCMCASTIRTPVLLPAGPYRVVIVVDELGRKTRAYDGTARIP